MSRLHQAPLQAQNEAMMMRRQVPVGMVRLMVRGEHVSRDEEVGRRKVEHPFPILAARAARWSALESHTCKEREREVQTQSS
jgi:hypothetical protein